MMCYYLNVHFQGQRVNAVANIKTYLGLHIKCQTFVLNLKGRIFIKVSNIRFHENSFNGIDVDTFEQTDRQRNTVALFAIVRTH